MKKTIYMFNTRENRGRAKKILRSKKGKGIVIIMLALPLPIHAVIAVLAIPRAMALRGARAQEIITACTGNTYVTIASGVIDDAKAELATFNAATGINRAAPWRIMQNRLDSFMALFQEAANADPANAITIIESGGFKVKNVNPHQKQIVSATQSAAGADVELTGNTQKGRCCHDWMHSSDGIAFTRLAPTVNAHTTVPGLTVGQFAYFTHELVTKDGGQGVSQIVKIMVT